MVKQIMTMRGRFIGIWARQQGSPGPNISR